MNELRVAGRSLYLFLLMSLLSATDVNTVWKAAKNFSRLFRWWLKGYVKKPAESGTNKGSAKQGHLPFDWVKGSLKRGPLKENDVFVAEYSGLQITHWYINERKLASCPRSFKRQLVHWARANHALEKFEWVDGQGNEVVCLVAPTILSEYLSLQSCHAIFPVVEGSRHVSSLSP